MGTGSLIGEFNSYYALMWVSDHQKAIEEIYRILSPQGLVAALEPDYLGRIEVSRTTARPYPPSTYPIIQYLLSEGANPYLGSQLPSALSNFHFQNIQFGVLTWQYDSETAISEIDSEAKILQFHDIKWSKPALTYTPIWWIIGVKPLLKNEE